MTIQAMLKSETDIKIIADKINKELNKKKILMEKENSAMIMCILEYMKDQYKEEDKTISSLIKCVDLMNMDELHPEIGNIFDVIVKEYENNPKSLWVERYKDFKNSVSPKKMNRICFSLKLGLMQIA